MCIKRLTFALGAAIFLLLPFSALAVPASAVDDTPEAAAPVVENLPNEETPAYTVVHVEAPEGDADLNTLAAVTMFGFGSVCGLLAGSEVVRKWTL